jgi:hypothetical protein
MLREFAGLDFESCKIVVLPIAGPLSRGTVTSDIRHPHPVQNVVGVLKVLLQLLQLVMTNLHNF